MESLIKLYIERAENELVLVELLFDLSSVEKLKNQFNLGNETFYSQVISHSYYCIFYCAKSFLISKGVYTKSPNEHNKVYSKFKEFVDSGEIDKNLGIIYDDLFVKAEILLDILISEKKKRGKYNYFKLPQANKPPAKESIDNAKLFFKIINNLVVKLK